MIANIGVLASGRGSNLQALLRRADEGFFNKARFSCVFSDVPGAKALEIGKEYGLQTLALKPREFPAKADYEAKIIQFLEANDVEFVCLAGYMRLVGPTLLERFAQRILNIHPSLLPSFPGLHAQAQAVQYGVRFSGCTVHFVDSGMDTGPIVAQRAVPVYSSDDEDALCARILEQEHQLYAEAVKIVTEKAWHIDGRKVVYEDQAGK